MRFSLIVATKNRTAELSAFLESAAAQAAVISEIIIIDQNPDDRLLPILARFQPFFPLKHVKSGQANSSHARNLGIPLARGEILAFPDDDCVYPPRLLERVAAHFARDPELGLLTCPARNTAGALGSGRWTEVSGAPSYTSIWTSLIEFSMFFHRPALPIAIKFDEALGVGAKYGSAEGVDLALRLKAAGAKLYYDADLAVIHPDKSLTALAVKRAYAYGTGLGYVMRKHADLMPKKTIMTYFIRPLGGMALAMLKLKPLRVRYYWQTFIGRAAGFTAKPEASPEPAILRSPAGAEG